MKVVNQKPGVDIFALILFPFAFVGSFFFGAVIGITLLILGKIDGK